MMWFLSWFLSWSWNAGPGLCPLEDLKVHASFPNQSMSVMWPLKRHSITSFGGSTLVAEEPVSASCR